MRDALRPDDPITNFGGNVYFTPRHRYAPRTEDDVLAILEAHKHGKIRVAGALHAWSPLVVSDDALIDMRYFNRVSLTRGDDGAVHATVGAGCRIKHLLEKLHRHTDHTLPSLGLITQQAIAGAISTATHGSGKHSLSHYVEELRVAAYDAETGKARIYTWNDGPELRAARCALGCMGVILSVRLRCVPKYDVAERMVECATLDEVLAGEADYPLQQFYLTPHLWTYFVQRRVAPPTFQARRSLLARLYRVWWFFAIDVGLHATIKLLTTYLDSPALTRIFYRDVLPKTILRNLTIVDHSEHVLVMEHELFKHLETEIFVPARYIHRAAALVQHVVQGFDGSCESTVGNDDLERIGMRAELEQHRGTFTHHYPITFRRVLPDDALIATSSGAEPYYAISFITYVEPRDRFYAMASFLARSMVRLFEARPHWGKHFPLTRVEVEAVYPNLPEFREMCRRVDPAGVFRNAFAERVMFT